MPATAVTMSEAQLQQAIIDLAHILNLRVAHFRPGLTRSGNWVTAVAADGAGFVDLVLVGRGRVIFAELKSSKGKLGLEQEQWRDALIAAGAEWYCWKPCHWLDGSVLGVLRRQP